MQGPYRPPPGPGPDPELARLAAQGQQRRMEAAHNHAVEQRIDGSGHLKTAIGAYRGSTLKRVLLSALLLGIAAGATGVVLSSVGYAEIGGYLIPGFLGAFIMFFAFMFAPPIASQGAIAAERAWMMGLPFQLTGYFELLSAEPRHARTVRYQIRWQDGARPPEQQLLHSIFGAVDPQARVEHADHNGALISSGAVSGQTGIRVNRVPVYRNHRLPAHIHGVVDQVLVTLHRSHPIAQVTLT